MRNLDSFYMSVAASAANLSYAKRLKVGSVAVRVDNILAFGYNGTLPGTDNSCEYETLNQDGTISLVTRDSVLHSEENLIIKLAKSSTSSIGATIYITHQPCVKCARMIAAAGFTRLVYRDSYRDTSGVELLSSYGVLIEKFED